jgi:hypothetical protein
MRLVKKLNSTTKLDQALMILSKVMPKTPSDALLSPTWTLKINKEDLPTKTKLSKKRTPRKTFMKLKKKTTLLSASLVSKISSEKKYQMQLLSAMKLVLESE